MIIKEEVINIEITYEELARIINPQMANSGFEITEINESEIKMEVNDLGHIIVKNGAIIKFKRSKK